MSSPDSSTQFLRTRYFAAVAAALTGCLLLLLPYPVRYLGFEGLLFLTAGAAAILSLAVHPLVCFTLYFSALFFAETSLPGIPLTANQVFAVLFFASAGSFAVRRRTLKIETPLLGLIAVITVYFSVSAVTGENLERGLIHMRYVVIYALLAISLAACLRTERTIHALAWIIVVTTFFAAMAGLVEAVSKDLGQALTGNIHRLRIRGTAKNPIVFGWNMLFAYPFAFLLYSEMRSRSARFTAVLLGLFPLIVAVLTFNRQTYLLIVVLLALTTALYAYKNRVIVISVVGAVAGATFLTLMPILLKRMFSMGQISRDASFLQRRDAGIISMEMFRENPLFGVGLGSFPAVWRDYIPADIPTYAIQYENRSALRFPDMGYLQLLSETGIVGLALYLWLVSFIALRAWKLRREALNLSDTFAANLCSTVLTVLAFVLLSTAIQDTFLYVRVWVMIALALLLDRRVLFPDDGSLTGARPT